ncbi:hypothetical protein AMECASPLE_013228 [Ameca splendens]|uniref:Uncharacterized protein n=1 Tax=Ameca splendens TaxID=208324 RepID=A0ABV0YZ86_9TELE
MPSLWKRITFSVASTLCLGSVVLLVVALSTERWVIGRILCKTGVDIVNASSPELDQFIGDIYYGLFQGGKTKSFSKAGADTEWWSSHDGDSLPAGGCRLRPGQSVLLHLQRAQGALPEHQRSQRTLPVELYCW